MPGIRICANGLSIFLVNLNLYVIEAFAVMLR